MGPSLTDTLCTRCGLCCDGSLFADVELSGRAEATRVESLGLAIGDDADRALLEQPCAALEGTRCGVYAHRPRCCRTFECRLLQDVRRGALDQATALRCIEDALALVRRAHAALAEAGSRDARLPLQERVAEALARESAGDTAARTRRGELRATMTALGRALRGAFLPDPGGR